MADPTPNVTVLPLTRERASDLVKEIVKAGRWSFPSHEQLAHGWKWLVTNGQVRQCLTDGYILDDRAKLDKYGNWTFRIGRVCAGMNVVITVAIERETEAPNLYVTEITGNTIDL